MTIRILFDGLSWFIPHPEGGMLELDGDREAREAVAQFYPGAKVIVEWINSLESLKYGNCE